MPTIGQITEYRPRPDGGSKLSAPSVARLVADTLNCFGQFPDHAMAFDYKGGSFVVSGQYLKDLRARLNEVKPEQAVEELARHEAKKIEYVA